MESSVSERSGLRRLFNLQMESDTSIGLQGRGQDGRYERGWGVVHTGWTLHSWGRPALPGSEHTERGHKARELRGETFQEGGSPRLRQILPRGG